MINRFFFQQFRGMSLSPDLRPRVNEPNMDRKTRADVRREILAKLMPRMQNLGIPNG